MILQEILEKSSKNKNISDIILSSWSKPCVKINGNINYLDNYEVLSNKDIITEISLIWIMNRKKYLRKI